MTWRAQRNQSVRTEANSVAIVNWSKRMTASILGRQPELSALLLGERPRTREVIGVDMGVDHGPQPPAVVLEQSNVDAGIDRGVDDDGLGL